MFGLTQISGSRNEMPTLENNTERFYIDKRTGMEISLPCCILMEKIKKINGRKGQKQTWEEEKAEK